MNLNSILRVNSWDQCLDDMPRTEDEDDRRKLSVNFRANLEILDGKIRRGERCFESMPLLDAMTWEESLTVM